MKPEAATRVPIERLRFDFNHLRDEVMKVFRV